MGLVTYYGKHYSTYLYNTKRKEWTYFDDATVRLIGSSWQLVVDKCLKGHFQPLLLLYANPNGTIVNTKYAFRDMISMTVVKKSSDVTTTFQPSKVYKLTSQNLEDGINKVSKKASYHEAPDSPSATSTTSYFSDIGDSTDGYISRKTVENILKIQQNKHKKQQYSELMSKFNKRNNRNSSSSIESFDSTFRISSLPRNFCMESNLICSLQRRDSGNSSSDRASSVSSMDTPYYAYGR